MSAVKVKICGITRYDDACVALDAGAWALGFVFHPTSPRFIAPERAAAILDRLPRSTFSVGVFVDWPLDELNRAVRLAGLRGAQLHGDESPEYAARVEAEMVMKAFRVGEDFDPARVDGYPGQRILLDTHKGGVPGGTGRVFDWRVAREVGRRRPFILAGGLTPENAAEAVASAQPEGIDVSSGVEANPGIKDPIKLRRLFEAVTQRVAGGH